MLEADKANLAHTVAASCSLPATLSKAISVHDELSFTVDFS